jgi:hypothetical protein
MASTSVASSTPRRLPRTDGATTQQAGPLDSVPLVGVYLIISLIALLAVELGYRLARNASRSLQEDRGRPVRSPAPP